MKFGGKTAVVTGAASGIGQALAIEAAKRGAKIVAADLIQADQTVTAIRLAGGEAEAFVCDITDLTSVEDLAARCEKRFGSVDMVAANAGRGRAGSLEECTADDFASVMGVNLFGTFYTVRSFAPLLRRAASANGEASLMITGSEHSLGVPPNQHSAAYTIAKHALLGLADVARGDFANSGVSVTFLCPGWTLTPAVVGLLDARPELAGPIGSIAQPPGWVAALAWDAVENRTFLAPTNPASRRHAIERVDEIRASFDHLSPSSP